MLKAEVGVVLAIEAERPGAQEALVQTAGSAERALNYPGLTGPIAPGERVLLNTTAVRLGLGTGGFHFVMKRVNSQGAQEPQAERGPSTSSGPPLPNARGPSRAQSRGGHIMKLRYTPLQFSCLSAEEPDSPHHELLRTASSLGGAPVIACPLHSMIAPAAAGVKAVKPGARIAYVMTDSAALPIAVSRLVAQLVVGADSRPPLLDATVTCGQAFGGQYEAVNIFSGLLTARLAAAADVIIAGQGPGNVGTDTLYGFGGIEQGMIINATAVLGGKPVAVLRISFAESRERHRVVSYHSLVALGRAALARAVVVMPRMADERARMVRERLESADIPSRHEVVLGDGEAGLAELARRGVQVETMGRAPTDDPEFFLAAAAAGEYAASLVGDTHG